ncbi:MAG TPA: class C sortase [Pseudogracilibacillus sp.]|nr:class C sortase [Pseudogracilibacillus sp.]
MKRKIILMSLFITGLLIFSYPIISNFFSEKEHHSVMSEHNKTLKEMTKKEKDKERNKAKEYNKELNEEPILVEDPFAENQTITESDSYHNVLDVGETIGSIEIPKLKVNLPIYHGVGEDVLQQGVGHMSNSSFPVGGEGSHTALTAHRGLPSSKLFRDLDKINEGDMFLIKALDETLAYQVDDVKIVLPTNTEWLEMKQDKDYVTLITCEPYMINTHRLLVRGERVPYNPDKEITIPKSDDNFKMILIISLIIIVIVGISIKLYLNKRKTAKRDYYE